MMPTDDSLLNCVVECERDNDCPELQKCCDNGCGRICVSPDDPGG